MTAPAGTTSAAVTRSSIGSGSAPVRTAAPQSGFAPWKDPAKKPIVSFERVTKRFGDFTAVNDVSLDIYEREFFSLLGPSGCGKTTLLRMLAGFETPTSGRILVEGQDITALPPYARTSINMMLQSYALFPHMTVERNIGFGLRQEGMPADQIMSRVDAAMAMFEIDKFAKRKPNQLSGGQQQRVALARAIAKKPRIMLLDEPLGALDKRLRHQAQFELMNIQEMTGTTFIIVTHDQEEAMTVSSRIAVMDHGRLVQVATPGDIYEAPATRYVANFLGEVNLFEGTLHALEGGYATIAWGESGVLLRGPAREGLSAGQPVSLAVRPEKIRISLDRPEGATNAVRGFVTDIGYLGSISHYHVAVPGGSRIKALRANVASAIGRPINWEDTVWLDWEPGAGLILTA